MCVAQTSENLNFERIESYVILVDKMFEESKTDMTVLFNE